MLFGERKQIRYETFRPDVPIRMMYTLTKTQIILKSYIYNSLLKVTLEKNQSENQIK